MTASKRLLPVKRIAESRERKAAKRFGDSKRHVHEQEAKLEELKRYHQEYLERFQETSRNGISTAQLIEYRAFLEKLELAIREQTRIVELSQNECTSRKQEWQKKHVRTQVLGKAVDRMRSAEQKVEEGREQKELDDRNQRNRRN
ncbi:flagellar export protein FliJ [Solemya velesiana gill symbiont]|uniref:Flagellar FliJ protein n=1 Tax=Solemya velesiana gill symbiont TaxID=1918948 RepID=A0A1T2KVW4_9GAMM|nr:flagellar export protein FliJ [Solemya velesiana gill symbiont]OOZ36998.1 flagellar export protein FliJ [Solemya velesiana gill symbiont]